MKRKFLALFLLGVFCAPEKKELLIWHAYRGAEKETLEKIVSSFVKNNPQVSIRLLQIPYDAFADKLNHAIPRGKGPDLFIFAHDRIGDWAEKKLIEPLDFLVEESLKEQFLEKPLRSMTYSPDIIRKYGTSPKLYGLPLNFKTLALYRNTAIIRNKPTDFTELISTAQKHTNISHGKFGLIYSNDKFFFHSLFHFAFGGKLFDTHGNPSVFSEEAVQGVLYAKSLFRDYKIIPDEISGTLTQSLFNEGKAAYVINGPWFKAEIDKKIPYEVTPIPPIDKKKKIYARPFLTVEGVMMSSRSDNKLQSFEFMKFLTNETSLTLLMKEAGQIPAHKKLQKLLLKHNLGSSIAFMEAQENAVVMPNTPTVKAIWTPLDTMLSRIIFYNANPDFELKKADKSIAASIKGDNI